MQTGLSRYQVDTFGSGASKMKKKTKIKQYFSPPKPFKCDQVAWQGEGKTLNVFLPNSLHLCFHTLKLARISRLIVTTTVFLQNIRHIDLIHQDAELEFLAVNCRTMFPGYAFGILNKAPPNLMAPPILV